jgi:hypothetical protein
MHARVVWSFIVSHSVVEPLITPQLSLLAGEGAQHIVFTDAAYLCLSAWCCAACWDASSCVRCRDAYEVSTVWANFICFFCLDLFFISIINTRSQQQYCPNAYISMQQRVPMHRFLPPFVWLLHGTTCGSTRAAPVLTRAFHGGHTKVHGLIVFQ